MYCLFNDDVTQRLFYRTTESNQVSRDVLISVGSVCNIAAVLG